MRVEPDHVYVIPPNVQMGIADDVLHLLPRPTDRSQYMPVDFFLRSLADAAHERAIGVILSGTASDGAAGIREIKAVGGITIAQEPRDRQVRRHAARRHRHRHGRPGPAARAPRRRAGRDRAPSLLAAPTLAPRGRDDSSSEAEPSLGDEQLQRVFALLRPRAASTSATTSCRRSSGACSAAWCCTSSRGSTHYLSYLQEHAGEVQALYQDLLIHVTRFFREPDSFRTLAEHVFPEIVEHQTGDNPIRVWVAGCSTGEEAYSVAIALLEFLGDRLNVRPDPDLRHRRQRARRRARADGIVSREHRGRRLAGAAAAVLHQGRRRLPGHQGGARPLHLRAPGPDARSAVLEARPDPVPERADLPGRRAAEQVARHLPLRAEAERLPDARPGRDGRDPRRPVRHRRTRSIASTRRKATEPTLPAMSFHAERIPRRHRAEEASGIVAQSHPRNTRPTAIVLERYAPPGVIVDDELQIVQFRGQTGRVPRAAPGDPSLNLLKMAREGLLYGLRARLQAARKSGTAVRKDGLRVKQDGRVRDVDVEVDPARNDWPRAFPGALRRHGAGAVRRRRSRPRPPAGSRRRPIRARTPASSASRRSWRQPRVPAVDHPGARGRQRGAAVGQRGDPLQQRGAAVHQRGARHRQGGAAVHQRGAQHASTRSCTAATTSSAAPTATS